MAIKAYETPKEWYQCIDAGTAAVRRPYALRQFRHPGIPRITFYHIPSFTDATGWTIYLKPRREGCGLQTVTWHQQADGDRMQNLMRGESAVETAEPTLTETFEAIDSDWVESRISELAKIVVPLHTNRPMGLDGESFGIHMRGEFQVEWWCDGPDEWRELISWAQGCIGRFNINKGEHVVGGNGG